MGTDREYTFYEDDHGLGCAETTPQLLLRIKAKGYKVISAEEFALYSANLASNTAFDLAHALRVMGKDKIAAAAEHINGALHVITEALEDSHPEQSELDILEAVVSTLLGDGSAWNGEANS
jgi:hypothetical protein